MSKIKFQSSSTENLLVRIVTREDPTDNAPGFEITASTATDPTGSWVSGVWTSEWDSVTGEVWAVTPLMGAGANPALQLTEGQSYKLWARWQHGTEDVQREAAKITAT